MKFFQHVLVVMFSVSLLGCASMATTTALVNVESRPGVSQGFIHIMPEEPPVASVILYAGSDGILGLKQSSSRAGSFTIKNGGNFLVRSRQLFANHGFQVAVLDVPANSVGPMALERASRDHIADSDAVANYLRSQADVPVWVVGTSRGTDSVANLATNGEGSFDGAVFTSSVQNVLYYDLEKVTIPSLVLHNKWDGCWVSHPDNAEILYELLENSQRRDLVWINSTEKKSAPCDAKSPHGFLGVERSAVNRIASFIKSND